MGNIIQDGEDYVMEGQGFDENEFNLPLFIIISNDNRDYQHLEIELTDTQIDYLYRNIKRLCNNSTQKVRINSVFFDKDDLDNMIKNKEE